MYKGEKLGINRASLDRPEKVKRARVFCTPTPTCLVCKAGQTNHYLFCADTGVSKFMTFSRVDASLDIFIQIPEKSGMQFSLQIQQGINEQTIPIPRFPAGTLLSFQPKFNEKDPEDMVISFLQTIHPNMVKVVESGQS